MLLVESKRLLPTRGDISERTREEITSALNLQLADLFDLYSQTKQAHWNVRGPSFYSLHKLFDHIAADLLGHVDLVAERVTALGGLAQGTVRMAAKTTRLPECALEVTDGIPTVRKLADRFAEVATGLRGDIELAEALEDPVTADILTEIARAVDKQLWFLESHLR
jgi:starvation-inducible DNA-binding protein